MKLPLKALPMSGLAISALLFQACGCKHYPFELLQDEVAEPLHAKIMAHKAQTGHYPDAETFGTYLRDTGCHYDPGAGDYPRGLWQCGEYRYRIGFTPCELDNSCDVSYYFTVDLGDFTSCDYSYDAQGFDRYRNITCVHAACISKYLH